MALITLKEPIKFEELNIEALKLPLTLQDQVPEEVFPLQTIFYNSQFKQTVYKFRVANDYCFPDQGYWCCAASRELNNGNLLSVENCQLNNGAPIIGSDGILYGVFHSDGSNCDHLLQTSVNFPSTVFKVYYNFLAGLPVPPPKD